MDLTIILWIALGIGALIAGAAVTGTLAAPRRIEPLFALAGIAAASGAVASLAGIASRLGRADAVVYALAFLLGFGGGGYALASTLLLSAPQPSRRLVIAPPARWSRRPCLIVCRCVEPGAYGFRSTSAMLQALVDEGLLEPSVGTLPLLFFAQKARYRLSGGTSPGVEGLARLAEGLQAALRELDPMVMWATCSGPTRLAARVAEAVGSGFARIIVMDVALSPGMHFHEAAHEAEQLCAGLEDVTLSFERGIPDPDTVMRMLTGRIDSAAASDMVTGVVLAAQGQPRERAERDPAFRERETAFVSRLRMMLLDRGWPEERVRTAWSEWDEPDVTTEARHLAALGCTRILIVPATRPLESLSTRSDLSAAVRAAHLDTGVEVVVMPAWGADPAITAALATSARAALTQTPAG